MEPETFYVISKSSLLDALRKSRYSGEDEELILNELEARNEVEEVYDYT